MLHDLVARMRNKGNTKKKEALYCTRMLTMLGSFQLAWCLGQMRSPPYSLETPIQILYTSIYKSTLELS